MTDVINHYTSVDNYHAVFLLAEAANSTSLLSFSVFGQLLSFVQAPAVFLRISRSRELSLSPETTTLLMG